MITIETYINNSDSTIINKSDLVISGKTSFSENDCIGRSVADNGKLRIKANGKYYYFNVPELHSIDNNICDTLNGLLVSKKVNKVIVDEFGNYGMRCSYSTSHIENGYFWLTIKNVDSKKSGSYKHNSNFIESTTLNQWNQITLKINLSFFGSDEVPTKTDEFIEYMKNNPEKKFAIYYEMNNPYQYVLEDEPILIDKCDSYEIIDALFKNTVAVKSNSLVLDKKTFDNQFLLSVDRRTRYASEFGCSYSDIYSNKCSGEEGNNEIVISDLYYLDFEVGQGIAIENSCYVRKNELSWLCAEIKDINYDTNTIIISRNLQATVNNVRVEHDNFIPYLKITDYFVDKDFVDLKFEPGTYLNHALRSGQDINLLKNILSEHNLARPETGDARCMIDISNKRFVNIDFQGSVFKEVAKWELKADENFGSSRCSVLPYSFVQLYGCDKVNMRNGKVDHDSENNCIFTGVRTAENMGNGFLVHGCVDITLENLEAWGCESDGFALGGSNANYYAKEDRGNQHIVLRNCKAYYCGRQGLTFSSGADGVIDNCDFSYTGFCKDGITKCWWGNRNPGAGIDFEFESASDLTTGWAATSAIRRIRVTNTKLIGNSYTLANGMTEGNFLMENCVLIGNPNGVFFIKTGNNAGFTMRSDEDEPDSYVFGTMQPITCTFKDCLLDPNGVPNKTTFGYFKRVIIDNCVLRNFTFEHSGRQVSILNSDLQYTDGKKAHMQGYPRFPLIQNCTVRFRKEFIDEWEKSNQWGWSPIYGQFQDCVFYLEEPSTEYTDNKTRNLIVDFGKNSTRNYVYPAKNYGIASGKNHDIIKEKILDWGDRECYEVYSKDDFNVSRIYSEDVTITTEATTTSTGIRTNFIISPDCPVNRNKEVTFCFRGTIIDYKIKIPANRNLELKKIYMYFWSPKAFKFSNGNTKFTYVIPEEYNGKELILEIKQDYFDELLVNVKLSVNETII